MLSTNVEASNAPLPWLGFVTATHVEVIANGCPSIGVSLVTYELCRYIRFSLALTLPLAFVLGLLPSLLCWLLCGVLLLPFPR